MEYHLRCNRFRDYAQKMHKMQGLQRQSQYRMAKPVFQIALHHNKTVMMTPERPKNNERLRNSQQQISQLRSCLLDPESDKFTLKTELTHLTEFKHQRPERTFSTPKENSSICMSESSATSKKRKSHFLTVVSRLPGMSKNKKINFP